jgi:protein TonB
MQAVINPPAQATPERSPLPLPVVRSDVPREVVSATSRSQVLKKAATVRESPPADSAAVASAQLAPERSAPSSVAVAPGLSGPLADHESVSPDDLRQYRVALAIAARRFKRYPPLARERGWEGRVEVAVSMSSSLPVPKMSLVRSSGHALLDEQAVSMVERASAATALPDGLRGRGFRVLLPIEFSMEDYR